MLLPRSNMSRKALLPWNHGKVRTVKQWNIHYHLTSGPTAFYVPFENRPEQPTKISRTSRNSNPVVWCFTLYLRSYYVVFTSSNNFSVKLNLLQTLFEVNLFIIKNYRISQCYLINPYNLERDFFSSLTLKLNKIGI